MDTEDEIRRDEWESDLISRIIEENRDAIVTEFVEDRLASYFEEHDDLPDKAMNALNEAKRLTDISPSAALVFAISSVEMAIQNVILKPVVAGLTHNPFQSVLIVSLIDLRNKQTEKVLYSVMKEIGMPNLNEQVLSSGELV